VSIRRKALALAPEQAILQRELGITLMQHFRQTEHQPSLLEAAMLIVELRKRDALEAQYFELAEQLAPIAAQVEQQMRETEAEDSEG